LFLKRSGSRVAILINRRESTFKRRGDDDSGPAESLNDWDLERVVQTLICEQSQECGSPPILRPIKDSRSKL